MSYIPKLAVCDNGHIVSHSDSGCDRFCSYCGASVIAACPHCKLFIKENSYSRSIAPKYCFYCGRPYPWTESAITALREIILEDEALSATDSTQLTESISDVICETPHTPLATSRFKKALKIVGKFTADAIRQFAIDFGCELAKKQLNL